MERRLIDAENATERSIKYSMMLISLPVRDSGTCRSARHASRGAKCSDVDLAIDMNAIAQENIS